VSSVGTASELSGVGGLRIHWRAWLPADGSVRAVVVIAHGAGEHIGRYEHVAARLVRDGYAVYGLDHRGHGRSEGPRALIDRVDNAVADLDSLLVLAGSEHPAALVFLLGHSMGGLIALQYALHHQDRLAGLILSGPLAALDAAPAPARLAARALSAIVPKLPAVAVDATLVSRDPAVVQAYQADPLVFHGKLPVRTVAELAAAVDSFPSSVSAITVPTLIMYGTADGLCPVRGSEMLAERIGATDKTVKAYDGLYHEIFNEPEQAQVLDELCEWLGARLGAGPGAAPAGGAAMAPGH
jgi:alpha-beta hydrolase superfamily lysophospholipase